MTDETNVDWDGIVASDRDDKPIVGVRDTAPMAAAAPLPDLPLVVGRLPIECGAKKAIVQLPEATQGVKCAAVFANTSVLSDCGNEAEDTCLPSVLRARPRNDREIEVVLSGKGERTVKGPGWKTDPYGGQMSTRPVDFGTPFVEVLVVTGRSITCGCDSENWASDNGWPQ